MLNVKWGHPADVAAKSDPENEEQTGDGAGQGCSEFSGFNSFKVRLQLIRNVMVRAALNPLFLASIEGFPLKPTFLNNVCKY